VQILRGLRRRLVAVAATGQSQQAALLGHRQPRVFGFDP
jgi:hypothetical protein